MSTIVNGRFLSRRATGVDRFAREVLRRLGGRVSVRSRPQGASRIGGHMWEQLALPASLGRGDILWSPANTGPVQVPNQVLSVHDLSPLDHPEWYSAPFALWYRGLWSALLPRVRKILVPSEFVKRRVIARFGPLPISIVTEGVDTHMFHPEACTRSLELPGCYVLFVGSLQPRKNLESLLAAWQRISCELPDTWLLIAGATGPSFRRAVPAGKLERVRLLGYVPDDELPGLYAGALLLVLPSHEEGFGLPVLEGMACGTPVLVSDGGALPETAGDAGMIFRLTDPNGLPDGMRTIINDVHLRRQMRQAGLERASKFTWEMTTELVWREIHAL
jgi:glycosyltransferase involved in cell wall biosynthesis